MNGEEKTFPTYLDMEEAQEAAPAFFLNNNRVGVILSMAVHALFIALFLLQPAAKVAAVKTFHISFSEGSSSYAQNSPPPAGNPVKKHPAPAMRKQENIPNQKAVATPMPPKEVRTAPPSPVVEKIAAAKPLETTLPIVANDPADARSDAFIAAVGNVPQPSAPSAETTVAKAVPGAARRGASLSSGIAAGHAAGNAAGNGLGNASGDGAMSGAGSGVPIETQFGQTNAPRFLHRAMPVYPPLARRRGKEGRVVLTLLIDQAGKLQQIDVAEPAGFGLTEAAIEAVKRSTFAPAELNGKKVASRAVLPIRFKLE